MATPSTRGVRGKPRHGQALRNTSFSQPRAGGQESNSGPPDRRTLSCLSAYEKRARCGTEWRDHFGQLLRNNLEKKRLSGNVTEGKKPMKVNRCDDEGT